MTLKEKFYKESIEKPYIFPLEDYEKIAEEFAIGFVKWIQISCTDIEISDRGIIHYFYNDRLFKTPEELLEIYNKEKGL